MEAGDEQHHQPAAEGMTKEQIQGFKVWIDRFNFNSRPSLKQAKDFLELKFEKSFPEDVMKAVIDEVFAVKEPPSIAAITSHRAPSPPHVASPLPRLHTGKIVLPGYGMSISHRSSDDEEDAAFPVLVAEHQAGWKANTLLIREYCMLKAIEDLTNKPEWWRKVRDREISAKWKSEMLAMDWEDYHDYGDFTPNMADACIDELLLKADMYEQTGLVPVFDYSACVIKSDTLLDDDLVSKLVEQVKPLEDVPENAKDWHPGGNGKVLDLVHPSLWPLVYGRTRIMPDHEIGLDDCLSLIGAGEVIPRQANSKKQSSTFWNNRDVAASSVNFQWLPCNVALSQDGTPRIISYINNLHPVTNKGLYPIIEQFIAKSLPAWDLAYRWPKEFRFQRLKTMSAEYKCKVPDICNRDYDCTPSNRPVNDDELPRDEDEEDDFDYLETVRGQLDAMWFRETHPMDIPDDKEDFHMSDAYAGKVKTESFFDGSSRIQVIVKLANIHLTPENPSYDGGSWHLEGQLNEHICATALFYYDNDNITESHLSLRTSSDAEDLSMNLSYHQSDVQSLARTFAVEESHEASTLQDVGSVLTRQGRALFFPNLFLHKVAPFKLQDPTRPGHRKILALFLVDPKVPIISTGNVPPQQRHWWSGEEYIRGEMRLPAEVGQMVLDNVNFPFDEAVAKRIREELMEERKTQQSDFANNIARVEFGFCEH